MENKTSSMTDERIGFLLDSLGFVWDAQEARLAGAIQHICCVQEGALTCPRVNRQRMGKDERQVILNELGILAEGKLLVVVVKKINFTLYKHYAILLPLISS